MARKKLTVEEMEKKNQENIDNFIKQYITNDDFFAYRSRYLYGKGR